MTEIDPKVALIAQQIVELLPSSAPNPQVEHLAEQLDLAQRQLMRLRQEDEGWLLLSGGKPTEEGPTLQQVKEMSQKLRAAVAESPLPKQANNLRASYTFSEPFLVPNLDKPDTDTEAPNRRGRKTDDERGRAALRDFAAQPLTQEYVLGANAQDLISTACATDGVYLLLGDDKEKTARAISLTGISDVLVNPDHPGEVWAYQRTWNPNPLNASSVKKAWYYTDRFEGTREVSIGEGPDKVRVDRDKTIIDLTVNNQTDWPLGMPDLWAGHVWNRNYLAAVKDGLAVTELLSYLTAKVKQQSKAGSDAAGVKIASGGPAGSVQTYGQGNSIDTYATTGKAYDFGALRDVAAIYALSVGVSVVDLLASPSAAGSSYGSAQALAPGMRRAISSRRLLIAAWMQRVLKWATGTDHTVTPASVEEETPYRQAQMLILAWNSGLFHVDEVRSSLANRAGIALLHDKAPEGILLPNNEFSGPRSDIDPSGSKYSGPNSNQTPATTGSPGQGDATGNGGQGSTAANDLRDDTIT